MINEAFYSNFTIGNIEYDENKVLITLKSNTTEAKCTCCGHITSKVHSRYERKILDLPILDKYTELKLISRRFFCINDNCQRKVFAEQFDNFLLKHKRLTERVSNHLIKIGLSQSANQGYRILNKLIPISASTILRLTKNYNVNVKYDAEFIGIDDFSFRKGITFGSIICDLKTGRPIDIIDSRNLDEVIAHLKLYKHAKIVSRDRSTTYAKAIKDALPEATQVADRFHIIHNFLESAADFLKRYIGKSIKIVVENNDNVTIEKEVYPDNCKIKIKKEIILKVKELYKKGIPVRQIVRELSISRNTVRKYIRMDNVEVLRFNRKPTTFDFYKDFIIKLLVQKKSYKEILFQLEKLGIKYSYSSMAKYANSLKKEGLPTEVKENKVYIFTRFNIIKTFWNYAENTPDSFEILNHILEKYPLLDDLFLAISTLKEVFDAKDSSMLEEWTIYNSGSKIKEIRSFINGVRKDYDSVANAIIYPISNGILEGNVNRLKTIKRSMFGRASFSLLRKKVITNI
ncbi:MAG: ISL3 family transposase [Clostridiaceae bacterium]